MSRFQVQVATAAAPNHLNEDYFGTAEDVAVLLDGAGFPGVDSGCIHGVRWFVQQLGAQLLDSASDPAKSLQTALRQSIRVVANRHEATCDLDNPNSPTATVIAVRGMSARRIEYLVLCDSSLLLLHTSPPTHITDHRLAEVEHNIRASGIDKPEDVRTALATHRNHPGGFWVAGPAEEAADHAFTGQIPSQLIALLSDGAARSVELFGQDTWHSVALLLLRQGPEALIRRVRHIEELDPSAARWPRSKPYDDATAALLSPAV